MVETDGTVETVGGAGRSGQSGRARGSIGGYSSVCPSVRFDRPDRPDRLKSPTVPPYNRTSTYVDLRIRSTSRRCARSLLRRCRIWSFTSS